MPLYPGRGWVQLSDLSLSNSRMKRLSNGTFPFDRHFLQSISIDLFPSVKKQHHL
jgi:hypothetical protein